MDEIKIEYKIPKNSLECSICLEYLDEEIYQCPNGPHYTCKTCSNKITSCSICRYVSKQIRNIDLEKSLLCYKRDCKYSECKRKIFNWNDKHAEECKFSPLLCKMCKKYININEFNDHFVNSCCFNFNQLKLKTIKDKYKIIFEFKPTINIILNKDNILYTIIIVPENDNYKIAAISNNENFIDKISILSINNDKINCKFNMIINNIRDLKFDIIIPKNYGCEYVIQGPNYKNSIKKYEDQLTQDLFDTIFNLRL